MFKCVIYQVGPPGLYEIKCAKKDDNDYISAEENTQTRYFSALGIMIVCKLLGFIDTSNNCFANYCHSFDEYFSLNIFAVIFQFSDLDQN